MSTNFTDESKGRDPDVVAAGNNDAISPATTIEVDEALKFLKAEAPEGSFSSIDEAKFVRKIDWYIMPMLFSVYFLQFTDKSLREDRKNFPTDGIIGLRLRYYSQLRSCDGY